MLCQQLVRSMEAYAQGWNFGPSDADAQPVSTVADIMVKQWGGSARWEHSGGEHPHEAHYLKLDCSKAKAQLKWFPIWGLERAIDETVQWYKAWYNQDDMQKFTLDQIKIYQQQHGAS
jgi:CDP-glucose 4,6-dehydratase